MNSKLTGEGDDEDEDVKKNIAILSIDDRDENQSCSACQEWFNVRLKHQAMKVPNHLISMRDWKSVRVRKSEISEIVRESENESK